MKRPSGSFEPFLTGVLADYPAAIMHKASLLDYSVLPDGDRRQNNPTRSIQSKI